VDDVTGREEAVRAAAEAIRSLPSGRWHAEGKAAVAVDAAAPHLTADLEAENRELREGLAHNLAREEEERADLVRERDEALAEVQRLHNRIAVVFAEGLAEKAEAEAAVARVEALHTPLERRGHTECAACQDTSDWMYPCATVRALRGDQ
jgi:hypothetical protein